MITSSLHLVRRCLAHFHAIGSLRPARRPVQGTRRVKISRERHTPCLRRGAAHLVPANL